MQNNNFTIYRAGSVESFEVEQKMFLDRSRKKAFGLFFFDEVGWVETKNFSLRIRFTSGNREYLFFDKDTLEENKKDAERIIEEILQLNDSDYFSIKGDSDGIYVVDKFVPSNERIIINK